MGVQVAKAGLQMDHLQPNQHNHGHSQRHEQRQAERAQQRRGATALRQQPIEAGGRTARDRQLWPAAAGRHAHRFDWLLAQRSGAPALLRSFRLPLLVSLLCP